MEIIQGGVTAPKGFKAANAMAGIKYKDRNDMAMIYSEVPCKAAGTFTTNVVKAAPVKWDGTIPNSFRNNLIFFLSNLRGSLHKGCLFSWPYSKRRGGFEGNGLPSGRQKFLRWRDF